MQTLFNYRYNYFVNELLKAKNDIGYNTLLFLSLNEEFL
ncbi:MAG: hypothetical protein RL637_1795 [Pseudomonadota bacterium]|jgi:hypothetical protein